MVTTRGHNSGGGRSQSPRVASQRPSRLAAATFARRVTDVDEMDDDTNDDFIESDDTDDDDDYGRKPRKSRQHAKLPSKRGVSKPLHKKSMEMAGVRRSSRLSAPAALVPALGSERAAGGAGSMEEDAMGEANGAVEAEAAGAGAADRGNASSSSSGDTSSSSGSSSSDSGSDSSASEDDEGGGAGAGKAVRGGNVADAGGRGEGGGQEEEGDEEEEGEDDGGVWKGRYHLRGQQVNQLRAHPAKRPRYSEDDRDRRHGAHHEDEEEEEDEEEDDGEEGDAEEEEDGGGKSRRLRSHGKGRGSAGGGSKKGGRGRKGKEPAGAPYTLRDRSRLVPITVQEQQRQQEELKKEMLARKRNRERSRSHGGGGGGKHGNGGGGAAGGGGGGHRRHGGGGWRDGMSDDEVADIEGTGGGNSWRNVHQAMGQMAPWLQAPPNTPIPGQPGHHATAHGGAQQVVPNSAVHLPAAGGGGGGGNLGAGGYAAHPPGPGGDGAGGGGAGELPLAPWEQALLADAAALAAGGGGAKEKAGNAEINPVAVDPSVGFDQVGGLDAYIDALKEMVFLPLVYPELFTRFNVQPPRGVLFYGPPGTGKTLVARALASHASRYGGRKVSFYMRKGADVLSKWVGEAERQLRLLFEEAQRNAPAIIFFDEIDGLAPVRSSRQDQIHNSIVSTLLALMDGLDSRGQVVVIGATNRPDALDGALRRPGRFDRELLFPLPGLQARRSILQIHTRKWSEPPSPPLLDELAGLCVGYCGADLKAVCAEAALHAVRRRYPQIYASEDKLLVEPSAVTVERQDFLAAIAAITPASNRSAAAHARPLPGGAAGPCLAPRLAALLGHLQRNFP
ncbi:hypothetical protein Agub_g96, partial [Astrephomene gubernaculifera]